AGSYGRLSPASSPFGNGRHSARGALVSRGCRFLGWKNSPCLAFLAGRVNVNDAAHGQLQPVAAPIGSGDNGPDVPADLHGRCGDQYRFGACGSGLADDVRPEHVPIPVVADGGWNLLRT